MSGFTPFKKHANKFNYLPRYYDPEKEERDRRRAELRGERAEDAGKEYKPGQYIRTQSQARAARRREEMSRGSGRMWMMVVLVVSGALFLVFGYPACGRVHFRHATKPKTPQTEEFNSLHSDYGPSLTIMRSNADRIKLLPEVVANQIAAR